MVHCRSPTKCLKNGHFPSNQIQIVPDSNCCKLFMDNGLPAGANFSPDTSDSKYRVNRSIAHFVTGNSCWLDSSTLPAVERATVFIALIHRSACWAKGSQVD